MSTLSSHSLILAIIARSRPLRQASDVLFWNKQGWRFLPHQKILSSPLFGNFYECQRLHHLICKLCQKTWRSADIQGCVLTSMSLCATKVCIRVNTESRDFNEFASRWKRMVTEGSMLKCWVSHLDVNCFKQCDQGRNSVFNPDSSLDCNIFMSHVCYCVCSSAYQRYSSIGNSGVTHCGSVSLEYCN